MSVQQLLEHSGTIGPGQMLAIFESVVVDQMRTFLLSAGEFLVHENRTQFLIFFFFSLLIFRQGISCTEKYCTKDQRHSIDSQAHFSDCFDYIYHDPWKETPGP